MKFAATFHRTSGDNMKSNNGGRNKFPKGQVVRYITIQGGVSQEEYLIDPDNPNEIIVADRKGLVLLKSIDGKKEFRIQSRRILPVSVGNRIPVIDSGNKYRAVCDKCQNVLEITGSIEDITCHKCQATLPLFWIGDRPMNDSHQTAATATTATTATTDATISVPKNKSKSAKPPVIKDTSKEAKSMPTINLSELSQRPSLELWTKRSVKFDHVEVDVQAHALLFTGENPRKLCFNTYDGALGKKASSLPIEEFVQDREVATSDKAAHKPWFQIKDLEKARAQLKKNGYEKA